MAALTNLHSTSIIEKDTNGDVLWTWSYPTVDEGQRKFALKKCQFSQNVFSNKVFRPAPFYYGRYRNQWYYISTIEVNGSSNLPKTKQYALLLWTNDFNPEKYDALSRILSRTYSKTGDPSAMLKLYLSVVTRGLCSREENGAFHIKEFDQRKAFTSADLRHVIETFKLETILIFTAVILKRRVVVYHHTTDVLLNFLRALPAFVWHRQSWDVVYPNVDVSEDELADLATCRHYIAGFVDASIEGRTDLYDLFINLAATEISVASHAKDVFSMSKTHKEIAYFMLHCAENQELSNTQIIKEISGKTKELLNHVLTLGGNPDDDKITLDCLKRHRLAPALEHFMYNLAIAEDILDDS